MGDVILRGGLGFGILYSGPILHNQGAPNRIEGLFDRLGGETSGTLRVLDEVDKAGRIVRRGLNRLAIGRLGY